MDKENILIANNQAFGDCLLGTHAARFIKKKYPSSTITFTIKHDFNLTTATDRRQGLKEALQILSLQDYIDDVGVINPEDMSVVLVKNISKGQFSKYYLQAGWFADLGIAKSAIAPIASEIGWSNVHTNTKFNVGISTNKRPTTTVALPGPLDWTRKLGNHISITEITNHLSNLIPDVEFIVLGRDVFSATYLEALQLLSMCHLYIGPSGSLGLAAAGLDVDVIHICNVFPPTFDSPEFYHSGNHHSVVAQQAKHCGTYKCITPTLYRSNIPHVGPPPTEHDFWSMTCRHMPDNKSCIANITTEDIIDKIDKWFFRFKERE